MFVQSVDLNKIQSGSKIVILFQDNKIELKKNKDKFLVLSLSNPERIKPNDIIEFVDFTMSVGRSPKCYIYRKNEIDKYKKTKMVHEFSSIKSIELA